MPIFSHNISHNIDTWGGKSSISPGVQMGWKFTSGLNLQLPIFVVLYLQSKLCSIINVQYREEKMSDR